jgi:hypothetical protein
VIRLLLILVLALLLARFLVLLVRHARAALHGGETPRVAARPAVPLVACSRCGVLVPEPRARRAGGRYLCGNCDG